jgi:hypothetical protein
VRTAYLAVQRHLYVRVLVDELDEALEACEAAVDAADEELQTETETARCNSAAAQHFTIKPAGASLQQRSGATLYNQTRRRIAATAQRCDA